MVEAAAERPGLDVDSGEIREVGRLDVQLLGRCGSRGEIPNELNQEGRLPHILAISRSLLSSSRTEDSAFYIFFKPEASPVSINENGNTKNFWTVSEDKTSNRHAR
jgi:hypothetical protein